MKRTLRVMLDTNCIDALAADPETAAELQNRRDLRLYLSQIQLQELQAIPDPARAAALLQLAQLLCVQIRANPDDTPNSPEKHQHDTHIIAAARSCDLIVSQDFGLLEAASRAGLQVQEWQAFLKRKVWPGSQK
ncbi:MAG: hypothetical protein KKI09_14880 [Spirochaetes bacterium]|nr:hypothetical protein [Spirochaetota bacterium]MBU0956710.1 hypothetical protein [Spirochaetota bacterium]